MSAVAYQFKKDFNEFDPEKKDGAWADRLVTQFRNFMEPFVDRQKAKINRSYLLGEQSVDKYKKKFAEPDKMPFEFNALGIFEKYRNILTAEREKAGIFIQLNALDPSAQTEKEYDQKLLVNSQFIEEMLSYAQQSIGMPRYELAKDKGVDGEKLSKGNLGTFKDLGLDPGSPQDVAYFFKTHYRIDTEIEAEDAVNHFVRINELAEFLKEWCDDGLALKAVAGRVYADEITNTPTYRYLRPEQVKWIKGVRRDGKDARAIMCEEDMTISELLGKMGAELTPDMVRDLIDAVNYSSTTHYDGLSFSNGTTTAECSNPISYDSFMNLKISVGYLEWKSIDVDTRKVGTNSLGNFKVWSMPFNWTPKEANSNYSKETIWNVTTYKTYFVSRSSSSQTLFKWGKLFDQNTYGPEDEYSSYSFQLYKQPGLSSVEIAIPFIDNIHDAWYRFCWILNKAKPKGTRYNYNVIAKIASKMYGEDPEANGVMKVIKMFHDAIDDFYVNDSLNPNVGGGQNPHFDKPNGLDSSIKDIYQVFVDNQGQIGEKLSVNAIREAYSPNPNDGYKLQMQALAQSRNATEFLSRMIMSLLVNFAKHTVTIIQDMIEFKGSKAYEAIERALGIKAIWRLQSLKRMPLHKFGIFVESFNTDLERQQQRQESADAWQKGEIPYHVYMLVKAIDNYKKAAEVLAYEKSKEIERKKQELEQVHAQKMEQIKLEHDLKMQYIGAEINGKMGIQKETNAGLIEVANINNQGHLAAKQLSIDAEPLKAGVRASAKIRQDEAASRIEKGEPAETADI